MRPVQEPFVWLTTSDWFPGLFDLSTASTREKKRESEWVSEIERANVIAMRPKLTKQKPQQKQTMRTALKFFKKFHVSCRSFPFSFHAFLTPSQLHEPPWGAFYGLLCLFLLGDARRRCDYRKVFEAKLFLSFTPHFFEVTWQFLANWGTF